MFGLLGPNGAGKTTTVLMLLGLTEPTAGEARVVGVNPMHDPLEVKRHVGYMPDSVGFYDGMSGRRNLAYTGRLNRIPGAAAAQRIDDLLDQVGLADFADRAVETYSRGMRQRLGIADALLKDPSVLILDEPTASLDPEGVAELLALIDRIAAERQIAVLLSSHLLDQVQSICHRVGIFYKGRLIADGTVRELAGEGARTEDVVEVGALTAGGQTVSIDQVRTALLGVAGVASVAADPQDLGIAIVTGRPGIAADLVPALTAAGLRLDHLRTREERLDSIYAGSSMRPPTFRRGAATTGRHLLARLPARPPGRATGEPTPRERRRRRPRPAPRSPNPPCPAASRPTRGAGRRGRRPVRTARRRRRPGRSDGRRTPMSGAASQVEPDGPRPASRADRPPSGGWRIVADKELTDHLGSVRFAVVFAVLALAGLAAIYSVSQQITAVAASLRTSDSLFPLLFTLSASDVAGATQQTATTPLPAFVTLSPGSPRCSASRSASTP